MQFTFALMVKVIWSNFTKSLWYVICYHATEHHLKEFLSLFVVCIHFLIVFCCFSLKSLLQSVESFDTQPGVLNLVEPTLSSQEELANDPTLQDPTEPLMTTQVQGALVPQGSVIMEMEDGTFMAQTPDGATMEIQAPDSMTLETLSELLDQATGALAATSQNDETVMPPSESLEKEAISPEDAVSRDIMLSYPVDRRMDTYIMQWTVNIMLYHIINYHIIIIILIFCLQCLTIYCL